MILNEKKYSVAVLIACYNRKQKTIDCIRSVNAQNCLDINLEIYVIDNGSDGTYEKIKEDFPRVNIQHGHQDLFWAGSMRKIWQYSIDTSINYDYFLLLNDDTILFDFAFSELFNDIKKLNKTAFILIGSTRDPFSNQISYGGNLLKNNYGAKMKKLVPNNHFPQLCHLGNGNIMLIPNVVVSKIGILSNIYTHGIADFDYTLRARKVGIETFIASRYLGLCQNDHGNNWWPAKKFTLKQRIKNMYDVKGLAYKEYLIYLKTHFPYYLPHAWLMLWLKTLFPFFWEKFKKQRNGSSN